MNISGNTKCLILALAVLLLLYFLNNNRENFEPANNAQYSAVKTMSASNHINNSQAEQALEELISSSEHDEESDNDTGSSSGSGSGSDSGSTDSDSQNELQQKMISKNHSVNRKVNYRDDKRGNGGSDTNELNQFFTNGNNVMDVGSNYNKFKPMDDSDQMYHEYQSNGIPRDKNTDLFNADNSLPKETNKNWFDTVPDPISVKNRNLINISKQVGVNTIGSSHKNASHDLRGSVPCPKFVVAPWLQSSIEPDTNIKSWC